MIYNKYNCAHDNLQNIETILGRWASGIEAEDTSSAIRKVHSTCLFLSNRSKLFKNKTIFFNINTYIFDWNT
jgi:hypothetical protein